MSEEKTITMAAVSVEAVFKVRYKNHQYDVEVCYNPGKSVAGVKKLIVAELKSTISVFKDIDLYTDWLTLKTLDGVVIMEDEMPEGKKFFADLDERLVDELKSVQRKDIELRLSNECSSPKISESMRVRLPLLEYLVGSAPVSSLYIRKPMVDVWDRLDSLVTLKKYRALKLQGAPGSGKTSLVWLWTVQKSFDVSMVYIIIRDRACRVFHLFQGDVRLENFDVGADIRDVLQILRRCESSILVIDGIKDDNFLAIAEEVSDHYLSGGDRFVVFLSSVGVVETKITERCKFFNSSTRFIEMLYIDSVYIKSWTLQEYFEALNDDEFWVSVQPNFDLVVSKARAIESKYFLCGGCARWMFGCSLEFAKKAIHQEMERIDNLKSVIQSLNGYAARNSVNHLFQLVDIDAESRPCYSLVSLYVIREMSSKYGFRLFRAAAKLLPENNAYLGYIFQEEFRQRMKKYKSVTLSLSECVKAHSWMRYEVSNASEMRIYECEQIIEFYSEEEIEALEGNILEKTFFDGLKINQAGFDCALLMSNGHVIFFQNTLGLTHSLHLDKFRKFIKSLAKPIHTVDIVVLIKDPSYFKFHDPQSNLYNINEHCRICPQLNIFVATMLDVSAQELKNQDVEMEEN